MRPLTNPAGTGLTAEIHAWADRVESAIGRVASERFTAMMLDTWTTTMTPGPRGVFVITGDIPAMWLRDSSAQVLPFLRLAHVPEVADVLRGVVARQWACIALDPYANAFNDGPTGAHFDTEDLALDPGVWERKYEVDSLAFPVDLASRLWRATGDDSHLDAAVQEGCRAVVTLWRTEQRHFQDSGYRHVRDSEPGDTLGSDGRGTPVAFTGMTWSGFRPSDDACVHGYNIPAQLMAIRALRQIREFAAHWGDHQLLEDASALAGELGRGVDEHGVADGRFAYEVDGLGGRLFMDDANMPSLLSLPLTSDIPAWDPRYRATRAWVLSAENPYFYAGHAARGIGSPHTPPGYAWHIALAVQGLTGTPEEARACLDTILATDGGTGWTHESFHVDDPTRFTRPWFSWSNSMTCELMMSVSGSSVVAA